MAWSVTVDGTTVLLLFCGSLLWWYLGATHHKQTVQPPAHQGTNNASENTNTRNSFVQPSSPIPVERPESDIVTPTSAIQIPVNKKTMPARDHLVKAATSEDPHLDQNLRPIPTEDHLSHSSTSASSSTNKTYRDSNAAAKAPGTDDSDRNALPKPKCFRIANVPPTWSRDDLLDSLRKIDSSLARRDSHEYQLSLYPACYGSTQTALLNLCTCSEYFQQLKPNDFNYVKTSSGTQLVIDSHFYDLTPLNSPGDYVVADVVAVTGLAGHAFGSWRNRDTHNMWLKDFLPEDVKYVRIMTYGYDSSIVGGEKSDSRLVDYRRNFIQQLENSRSTAKDRPVIFLGHSLGGILILQTLVESNRNPHHKSILDSTRGIFFFGTPHQGLRTDELEEMIDVDSGGQRCNLIMQLKEGSEFLENQKEDLIRIWEGFKQKVVSFYETVKTPSVKESESGRFERNGEVVQMVQRFSAQLYLSSEHRIPVRQNHTDMVKFASRVDTTYQTVVNHMTECIVDTRKMLLSAIDRVNPDQFLRILSAVDQEKHKSAIQPLDYHSPKFYWIFRNMDFKSWISGNVPQMLWISGPPECRISDASRHIVDLTKIKSQETQHWVLCFFCSSADRDQPIAITLVRALISQIVHLTSRKKSVIYLYLRTLLDSILKSELVSNWELSRFRGDDSPDTIISKVLDASSNKHWDALKAVLDIDHKHELFLIIDGLDKIEHQRVEFIREVYTFYEQLQESSTIKALLTSRPHAEIKVILDGLPCIEYDKERQECLNTLRFDNTRVEKIEKECEGSLNWFWVHKQYLAWLSTDTSDILFIEGKPGSGKSTLMKYVKRNLLEQNPLPIVASFFYSYREGELQTNHSNMLRSILYEILYQNESFFFHFQSYYRETISQSTRFQWSYESLKEILLSIGDHPAEERLYFIVDAMDESNINDRRDIIESLHLLCSKKKSCTVKIFLASRPVAGLSHRRAVIQKIIRLQDENVSDILNFARSFLGPDLEFPPDILLQATEYIVKHAQGVFIWVALVKETLLAYADKGYTKNQIFVYLKSLPTELEGFYRRILNQLENGEKLDIEVGTKMFRLVLLAYRPLTVTEFRDALAIPDDLQVKFIPDESFGDELIQGINKRIIHCGGNLLEIKDFFGNGHVQVMHQTVREFFLCTDGPVAKSKFSICHEDAHARISIICVRYLMLCAGNTTLENTLPSIGSWAHKHFETYTHHLNNRPFINYVLNNLKYHMDGCRHDANVSRYVSHLVERLTGNRAFFLFESWVKSHLHIMLPGHKLSGSDENFKTQILHTAARMGFSRVVEVLLTAGAQVEARFKGKTPLIVSADRGDDTTVRVLNDWHANKEAKDDEGQTALHHAAFNSYESTVRLLVETLGANKEATDNKARTALHYAALNGHESTVRMLVETLGADKEAKDTSGWTALHHAAFNGHESTVRLLVETLGADKEATDKIAQTALHHAASNGHDSTVHLLIETLGADKEATDKIAQTALHHAASNGRDSTVQLLVETLGAEKEAIDKRKQTALHHAASNGHDSTVQLLVKTLNADKEAKDIIKCTPLYVAAIWGHESTVQLLATFGANIEAENIKRRTALHWAAVFGRKGIVQVLVNKFGANKEAEDFKKHTALHLAAAFGRESTVRLLANTLQVNKEAQNQKGETALDIARLIRDDYYDFRDRRDRYFRDRYYDDDDDRYFDDIIGLLDRIQGVISFLEGDSEYAVPTQRLDLVGDRV